ncbi:MAG: polysaccharide biosynthesis protein [Clostridiales bacterium]|nr:polysaccharide biosynthesis protein [Clostridiales bacterium]
MEKSKIIKGAFILTLANIITRILGFVYRVCMADLIGAEGMGLYQLITPVYMLVWSISSSGFSTVISKLSASETACGRSSSVILKISCVLSGLTAAVLSLIVFKNSYFIAERLLGDARTALSLRLLCFCFPFMALGSCIRGWFFGMQNSFPPAASQVVEQVSRMTIIFLIGGLLIPKGIEYACAAAVTGMAVGETVSCIYIAISFLTGSKGFRHKKSLKASLALKLILVSVIPLTLNRLTSSLLSALQNVLIPSRLMTFGLSKTAAVSEFGRLSGMAMPLLMFPSSFLTAVSITIVPAISESFAKGQMRSVRRTIEKSILFSSVTGFGAAALFTALPSQISVLVYGEGSISSLLFMLGFLCPFMYLNVMTTGILNGMGEQTPIFINGLAGSAVCLGFVWFAVPELGIGGCILGSLFSMIITCGLNILRLIKKAPFSPDLLNLVLKPMLCALLSALMTDSLSQRLVGIPPKAAALVLCLFLMGAYFLLLLAVGSIKKEDIRSLLLQNR